MTRASCWFTIESLDQTKIKLMRTSVVVSELWAGEGPGAKIQISTLNMQNCQFGWSFSVSECLIQMHINPESGGAPGELLIVGPAEGSSPAPDPGVGSKHRNTAQCCDLVWEFRGCSQITSLQIFKNRRPGDTSASVFPLSRRRIGKGSIGIH